MRSINTKRTLSALLAAATMMSFNAGAVELAAQNTTAEAAAVQSVDSVLLSLTDERTTELTFALTAEQYAAAQSAGVTWKLQRTASFVDPEDEELHPLANETELFPNQLDEIAVADGDYFFGVTTDLSTENQVTVRFTNVPMTNQMYGARSGNGDAAVPHVNGGSYMDRTGVFTLVGSVNGSAVATQKDVVVKPYDSFNTMWDIYDELDRLSGLGDNNANTAKPYVVERSMGTSNAGYNMPYLIVAKDSSAVDRWLALAERAETDPDGVLADLNSGRLGSYQVPVMFSNIHANEVSAADGVLEFARMLVEETSIDYKKLTGLTDAGEAQVTTQTKAQGLHVPELVAQYVTHLGGIWADADSQASKVVPNFDSYYTSETAAVNVDDLLDDVFFILVPEENVEGRLYLTRTSSGGHDLNRDNSFQTQAETQNMQHLISTYNPVSFTEFHGAVEGFQLEPCSPPHEPNVEYDLLSEHLMAGGEAMGAAAVANNDMYQSYVIPMRDYLRTADDGRTPYWNDPWDDMSTSYTPQFAMLQGTVSYTVELPAYNEESRKAATYGMVGQSDYIAEEKAGYLKSQVEIFARSVDNENTDAKVGPWLADANDVEGAEADLFRPAYDGANENGQFFPEAYIIPLDAANQSNLQAAWDMMEWLTRNDVKVSVTDQAFTYQDVTYPAGTMVVSMYQAKRAVANGALYDGTLIEDWPALYSEGITAFNYTRGFDMVTCAEPSAYKTIAAAIGTTLTYDTATRYISSNARSAFSGEMNGDVIISNASEDSTAAVNALLQSGRKVGMITAGDYMGDFVCSYTDWLTVADAYVLTGTGVTGTAVSYPAKLIEKAPKIYINGTTAAWTPSESGYVYTTLVSGSYAYNYDRQAMALMGFDVVKTAAEADVIVGQGSLDSGALAAVQSGKPLIAYGGTDAVSSLLNGVTADSADGMDCLGYVTYPTTTLTNASYVQDHDNVLYGYGLNYFTAVPSGATTLVQMDSTKAPMEGFFSSTGSAGKKTAFLGSVQAFSYEGADKSGHAVNVTAFANTLTNKVHQRDEYAFISNTVFANMLSDTAYAAGDALPVDTFTDMGNHWSRDAVNWAVENGLFAGTTPTTFSPDRATTRAMMVTVLHRMDGNTAATAAAAFTDVNTGDYFEAPVAWAAENEIVVGTSATTFAPYREITREQLATILYRYAQYKGMDVTATTELTFADAGNVSEYAAPAMQWACSVGLVSGKGNNLLDPTGTATRAQVATMLMRFAQL